MQHYIGLDIGTTSVKACTFSINGKMLAEEQVSYELDEPEAGAAEQDPEAVFKAAEKALATLIKNAEQLPTGIGISAAMHSVILLDKDRQYISPIYTWADTRASVESFSSEQKKQLLHETGTPVHPMSPLVKLIWLKENRADLWEEMVYISDIKSALVDRWTKDGLLIDTNLASATGLYDLKKQHWHKAALAVAGITADKLPKVVKPTTKLNWKADIAQQLGCNANSPLFIGGSDGCLANLGSGLLTPGNIALTIGTSGATRTTHRALTIAPELGLFNYHLLEDRYVMGGASNNGGKLLEWLHELLGNHFNSIDMMIEAAEHAEPDGLVFSPYLYGERAPIYDAKASATFSGMRGHHQPAQYARAVIEGITDNMVKIISDVEAGSQIAKKIVASGGFTRSAWWVRLFEEKCGRSVEIAETPQASAYGAALIVRIGLGEIGLDSLT